MSKRQKLHSNTFAAIWKFTADPDYELSRYDYSTLLNPDDHIPPPKLTPVRVNETITREEPKEQQETELEDTTCPKCPVCNEVFGNLLRVKLKCGHYACRGCIANIMLDIQFECPVCQKLNNCCSLTFHVGNEPKWTDEVGCVFEKTLQGQKHKIVVRLEWTIEKLKEALEMVDDVPPPQRRLIALGKQLADDKTLRQHGIEFGTVMHTILAIRGD